jgi:hypothetical protein
MVTLKAIGWPGVVKREERQFTGGVLWGSVVGFAGPESKIRKMPSGALSKTRNLAS